MARSVWSCSELRKIALRSQLVDVLGDELIRNIADGAVFLRGALGDSWPARSLIWGECVFLAMGALRDKHVYMSIPHRSATELQETHPATGCLVFRSE